MLGRVGGERLMYEEGSIGVAGLQVSFVENEREVRKHDRCIGRHSNDNVWGVYPDVCHDERQKAN